MFELIIFIIIISFIRKAKKKKTPNASEKRVQSTAQQRPVQSRPQSTRVQSTAQQRTVQSKAQSTSIQGKTMQSRPVQSKPEEMSTTEMLEAKAQADDREEMLEKQRQRIENKKHYGHHNYAEKYILGDSMPKGKKMVFCPYCNAENLIPTYSAAKDYNCYFCRETL